jgi:hypothetical protein
MAATLIQADFTYRSGTSPDLYTFTLMQNQAGTLLVRDIQDPYGLVVSPYTEIPQTVVADIASALTQVEDLLALTSAVNGTLTFTAETSKTVTFATALSGTTYRVHLVSDVFAPFRVISKTTTGFTIEAGATVTGTVGYDVLL